MCHRALLRIIHHYDIIINMHLTITLPHLTLLRITHRQILQQGTHSLYICIYRERSLIDNHESTFYGEKSVEGTF